MIQTKIILFTFLVFSILSCKKDKVEAVNIDQEMYNLSQGTTNFTFYKKSNALLEKGSGSGHNYPFLKTKYNQIASTMLDSSGKVKENAIFPEGSLIVKELYNDETTIGRFAVLYKKSGDENADAKGWIWGYINSDKSVAVVASQKGGSCISCHSQSGNIDYMLMNAFHP